MKHLLPENFGSAPMRWFRLNARNTTTPLPAIVLCLQGFSNVLTCGKAMSRRNYGSQSKHKIFVCGTYATYGSFKCTQHKIFEDDLIAAVLADIQSKAELALNHREALLKLIVSKQSKTDLSGQNTSSAQYKKVCKRLDEINKLVDRLYEDNVLGRISEDNFDRMMGKYQSETARTAETKRLL